MHDQTNITFAYSKTRTENILSQEQYILHIYFHNIMQTIPAHIYVCTYVMHMYI